MGLGIPGKIIKIYGSNADYADVDFGGVIKKINVSMAENLNLTYLFLNNRVKLSGLGAFSLKIYQVTV